jgi:uroporphyrinogen decarboxylase
MTPTPRDIVRDALTFHSPRRLPRDVWTLPWIQNRYPKQLEEFFQRYPNDITRPGNVYRSSPCVSGDACKVGEFVDEWGCTFTNIQEGVVGEVRNPSLPKAEDWRNCRPPYETLPENPPAARDQVNRDCAATDLFVMASCCPRPWERMQFLRGTVNAMMDLTAPEDGGGELLRVIHEFFCRELEFWVATDVDGVMFMDDWGSQRSLLISPATWRSLFKPLYRDYCDLIHAHGKFTFMHSDGCISEIYDDLVEVGVDAVNSQLFTMDLADLSRRVKGKITFWGEIDRQHVLPADDPQVARQAVRKVARHLYDPSGGIITQFELGPASRIENAYAVLEEWDNVSREGQARKP